MKTTIIAAILACLALPAFAETPNRTTMGFDEFILASGCTFIDMGGYRNIKGPDGGGCAAITKFFDVGQRLVREGESPLNPDDGDPTTDRVISVSDN